MNDDPIRDSRSSRPIDDVLRDLYSTEPPWAARNLQQVSRRRDREAYLLQQRRRLWQHTLAQLLQLPAVGVLGGVVGVGIEVHMPWLSVPAGLSCVGLVVAYWLSIGGY